MKEVLVIIVLSLFAKPIFGQGNIFNYKSEKHLQISGTKFFLIPPPDFIEATNFSGYQHKDGIALLAVMEMPGPFHEASGGFDNNNREFRSQGMVIKQTDSVFVNESKGVVHIVEQNVRGALFVKYLLMFKNDSSTSMLMGTYPKEKPELDYVLRESIRSVYYDNRLTIDPLSSIPFLINTERTKLKYAKIISKTIAYTCDGKLPTESSDKTSFIVGHSMNSASIVKPEHRRKTAVNRFKQYPYADLKFDEATISEILIDGLPGYEIFGEGIDESDNTKRLIYQAMLFDSNGYYLMTGTSTSELESNLQLFRKISQTFELRK